MDAEAKDLKACRCFEAVELRLFCMYFNFFPSSSFSRTKHVLEKAWGSIRRQDVEVFSGFVIMTLSSLQPDVSRCCWSDILTQPGWHVNFPWGRSPLGQMFCKPSSLMRRGNVITLFFLQRAPAGSLAVKINYHIQKGQPCDAIRGPLRAGELLPATACFRNLQTPTSRKKIRHSDTFSHPKISRDLQKTYGHHQRPPPSENPRHLQRPKNT